MKLKILLIFLIGFIGGIAGSLLVTGKQLEAAVQRAAYSEVAIYNNAGQRAGYLVPGRAGQGMLWLYDGDGQYRMQMGTYESGSEMGQALIGMHDRNSSLRTLWRLYGNQDSPVLIFKDKRGSDRLVIGLQGYDETPYIEYTNAHGQRINLLEQR